jgi:2-polyprenyl-6-hydroxyphenyl methylase/3-demethylubiquinone-9 3-methyltransferase
MDEGARFGFGSNWRRLDITDDRIAAAAGSLQLIFPAGLRGVRFLDIGCGSGLFSLAAVQQGAAVRSFDYDPMCVECARMLKRRHAGESTWTIERGSILDDAYIQGLGLFDVVYSWGVLHHTGNLRVACRNAASLVRAGGHLVIAIYNDQGWRSKYWKVVKKLYCTHGWLRPLIVVAHLPLVAVRMLARLIRGQPQLERGMSVWRDYIDWIGGYPFEVASRDGVLSMLPGYELVGFRPATSGCNEFHLVKCHA